jgi:hypothetical protein
MLAKYNSCPEGESFRTENAAIQELEARMHYYVQVCTLIGGNISRAK